MTTEVYEVATGNQCFVLISAHNAKVAAGMMGSEFDTRPGPELIGLPQCLPSERFPVCDAGHSYENLGQYRVSDDGYLALMVKHLVSGVIFYKMVDDFVC
jgi:hypothetical protein